MRPACLTLFFLATSMWAQRPTFEVASIKPNTSDSNGSSSHGNRGDIVMTNQSLRRLIQRAYVAKDFQISGPAWLDVLRFDINAKFPEGTKESDGPLMLRSLLEDRFKMKVHRETKDAPGFALVVARGGFKLKPVEPGSQDTNHNGGAVHEVIAQRNSLPNIADFLARILGQVVVDKTGIDGVYDFKMRWANDTSDEAPSLFTAVEATLGLKLQPQRVSVDIFVVDSIERVPTDN